MIFKRFLSPICVGTLLAAGALTAPGFLISQYKAAPSVRLHMPEASSQNKSDNPFNPEDLLGSRNVNPYEAAGWTTLVPEADGKMRLAGPAGEPELHTYATRLRSSDFAKGQLKLKSSSRAEVRLNGESIIRKTSTDSVALESTASVELLPETVYDILIDVLTMPDDVMPAEFSLEFEADKDYENSEISASPEMKRRVNQAIVMSGERVGKNTLSADGKYMLVSTTDLVSEEETIRKASIRETATGNVISASIPTDAIWFGKENAYLYTAKRNGKYDVYKTEVPTNKTSLIASGLPEKSVMPTPDGKFLLYYKNIEAKEGEGPMIRLKKPDDRIPGDRDRSYIMRYDLQTKTTVPVTYGGPSTIITDFSNDSRRILYMSVEETPEKFPFYATTLVDMDLNTLKGDTILKDFRYTMTEALYSPDAKEIFIVAGPDAFEGIGANYGSHEMGNDFDGQGFIYNIESGEARAVTRDFDPAIVGAEWDAADGYLYILGETGFFQYIYRLDPKSGKITHLPTEIPTVRNMSVGSDSKEWLAYTGGSFTSDGATYVLNLKSGKSRLIADPLAEITKDVEFGDMQSWNFTADDGSLIEGWMCLPPEFDSSKKYPLIVYYYGGTSPSNASFYHNYSPQVFASRDYVVYVLNPSGTTGYGQEFSARHVNAWGKQTAEEIIEGTKRFCETHKFVDEKKIGCIGASYGGFMTMYLQTLTDIFAAAVSHAGISNVTSYWGEGFWGYSYNSVAAAKRYPWSDPDLFTKQGALFNADKIHTPILLLHGEVDTNVPIGESIQLFNALKILGRDVEFITVQDENHIIRSYNNRVIWQNTIMAWFAKYLKDDPKWWNSLYGD